MLRQAIGLSMPDLAGLKSLNRLEQVMLKREADQKGWPEALVSDVQGAVAEGVATLLYSHKQCMDYPGTSL